MSTPEHDIHKLIEELEQLKKSFKHKETLFIARNMELRVRNKELIRALKVYSTGMYFKTDIATEVLEACLND